MRREPFSGELTRAEAEYVNGIADEVCKFAVEELEGSMVVAMRWFARNIRMRKGAKIRVTKEIIRRVRATLGEPHAV